MKKRVAKSLLLLAATLGSAASNVDKPDDYMVTAPVVPASTAPVQRLDLPAGILAALQSADGTDVRLFDRNGRVLPMARGTPVSGPVLRRPISVLPILGSADTLDITGVSLTLDGEGRAQVVGVNGRPVDRGGAVTLGALLDARPLTGSGRALELSLQSPAGQPVTLDVDASADLKTWRPVAEQVAYQSGETALQLSLPLADLPLDRTWLRVSWSASSRLLSPVAVRGAAVLVSPGGGAAAPTIGAIVALSADRHVIEAALPFATPLTGLAVEPAENAIVPIRILGRADSEQPWRLLGTGTAARVAGETRGGIMPISGAGVGQLRIQADARTDGFAEAPALTLRFAPATIVFATGPEPLTLAAGKMEGDDRFLPLPAVLNTREESDTLPVASVIFNEQQPLQLTASPDGMNARRWLLWGVLLLATSFLGWIAWQLTEKSRLTNSQSGSSK